MATIVTRSGKGSALTHTEMDANFTNLNTDKLENVSEDATPELKYSGSTKLATTSTGIYVTGTVDATYIAQKGVPMFNAYLSSGQSISNNTWTKIQLNAEGYDTHNSFDSTTNYRFQPTIEGFYQIFGRCGLGGIGVSATDAGRVMIWKNGSTLLVGSAHFYGGSSTNDSVVSGLAYMNGTTDYLELYYLQFSGATRTTNSGSSYCAMEGILVRG